MSFATLFRASMYLMLFFATLVVSVDMIGDYPIAVVYPPLVAVAGVAALLTVDRGRGAGMPQAAANALAFGSIALMGLEYQLSENLLLTLAHWLVYLQIVQMFRPKTVEVDWFLFLLGVMQVIVGTFMSQSDVVGVALFAWALSALWVLGLFYLHREALARRDAEGPGVTVTPAPQEGVPYPGLLDLPFLFASLRVVAVTLALGGLIFLAMPRRTASGWGPQNQPVAKHLTGFGEEVQLGQIGEILENDSVVMSVELFDGHDRRIRPGDEPLWRGIAMGRYEGGRWQRMRIRSRYLSSAPRSQVKKDRQRIQKFRLEPTDTAVLFGLRPVLDAYNESRSVPELNELDGTLHRSIVTSGAFYPSGTYDYQVWSDADSTRPQPFEQVPREGLLETLLQVPEPLRQRLRRIAEPLIAGIPEDRPAERARALESYLRDTGGFGYTLHMDVVDPDLDPVVDFLVNRKQGHCAYFASALTLLLRSVGIPARLVNGFKGGDWNDLTGVLTVRQMHAHSWAEAYVGTTIERGATMPVWIALDPTPGGQRDAVVARVGGVPPNFRIFTDLVRYIWVFYIVGFDAERQQRVIYQPILRLLAEARAGYAAMAQGLWATVRGMLGLRVSAFFSVRGFIVSFFALLMVAGLFRALAWLVRRLVRWVRGPDSGASARVAGVAFYRRLVQVLAEHGLQRPPAETPREFARRAALLLAGRDAAAPVADVPPQVVAAFYRVRFGHRQLDDEALHHLRARLDALEASLRPEGQGG